MLPGGSEALFIYQLTREHPPLVSLLIVASLGNTLGSCINYILGKYAATWAQKKKYMSTQMVEKSHRLFERYGAIALLFSWAPIIGDPLTFVAGMARYAWWRFVLLVTIAKTLRYAFLMVPFL